MRILTTSSNEDCDMQMQMLFVNYFNTFLVDPSKSLHCGCVVVVASSAFGDPESMKLELICKPKG